MWGEGGKGGEIAWFKAIKRDLNDNTRYSNGKKPQGYQEGDEHTTPHKLNIIIPLITPPHP